MLILDLDRADAGLRAEFCRALPIHGVWGGKCRDIIHTEGAVSGLFARPRALKLFCDMKVAEVGASVESVVSMYARFGSRSPSFFSVSGELSQAALQTALRCRGSMEIVAVLLLSDWDNEECRDAYKMRAADVVSSRARRARAAGVECVACPAWLLPVVRGEFRVIIATGVRSEGAKPHEHKNVRTFADAFRGGATHAVVGREVIFDRNPMETLQYIAQQCELAHAD